MWPFTKKQTNPSEQKFYLGAGVYYTSIATWSEWNTENAIKEGFKCSAPVFSCVKRRYDAISSIPLFVEELRGDTWERVPNHPLQLLLNKPNPMMSLGELMRVLVTHMDLGGNGYWSKVRDGQGNIAELWPLVPYPVDIRLNNDKTINTYLFGPTRLPLPSDDVCHYKFVNPDNMYYGQSPLMAGGKAVDTDNQAQTWQKVSMQNRGVPDYMISYEEPLTEDQVEQVKERISEKTGSGNAREPLVTSKARVQQLSLTPVEMDFVDSRRQNREEICSVYGVPSALIAEMGNTNLANSETARKVFWLDTVIPYEDELLETMNRCLVPEYTATDNLRIVYDLTNIAALQTNLQERVTNAKTLWSMGVPFNVINQRLHLGFDDIDGGDVGYIASSNIPTSFDFEGDVDEETKRELIARVLKQQKDN